MIKSKKIGIFDAGVVMLMGIVMVLLMRVVMRVVMVLLLQILFVFLCCASCYCATMLMLFTLIFSTLAVHGGAMSLLPTDAAAPSTMLPLLAAAFAAALLQHFRSLKRATTTPTRSPAASEKRPSNVAIGKVPTESQPSWHPPGSA